MLKLLVTCGAAVAALAAPLLRPPRPVLVWNASSSAPLGLYYVQPFAQPRVGALVLARPSAAPARFLAERGYLPSGVPLLKRIAALPGQTVCRDGRAVLVDGQRRAGAFGRDHSGRVLPAWHGCHRLRPGEVFLLNTDTPYSLDSRYFGPLPVLSIVGRATPIWTSQRR